MILQIGLCKCHGFDKEPMRYGINVYVIDSLTNIIEAGLEPAIFGLGDRRGLGHTTGFCKLNNCIWKAEMIELMP